MIERYNLVIYRTLGFLAIALPLAIFPIGENVYDLPKTALLTGAAAFLLLAQSLQAVSLGELTVRRHPVNLTVAAFAAWLVVSSVFTTNFGSTFIRPSFAYWLEPLPVWLSYVLLYFVSLNVLAKPSRFQGFFRAVGAGGLVVAVYALLQSFGIDFLRYDVSAFDQARVMATLGNPTVLGSYLVLIFPISLMLCLLAKHRSEKALWLFLAVLVVAAVIPTYSRGAWLGLAASLITVGVLLAGRRSLKAYRRYAGPAVLLLAAALSFSLLATAQTGAPFSPGERIVSAFGRGGAPDSAAERIALIKTTVSMIGDAPLIGTGLGTFGDVFPTKLTGDVHGALTANLAPSKPHNQLLYLAASTGIPGALIFLALVGVFLVAAFRRIGEAEPRTAAAAAMLCASVVGYLVQGLFLFSVSGVEPFFWIAMGAVGALLREPGPPLRISLAGRKAGASLAAGAAAVLFAGTLVIGGLSLAAEARYQAGLDRAAANDQLGAIDYFHQAVRLNPYEASYRSNLGWATSRYALTTGDTGPLGQAIIALEKGVEIGSGAAQLNYHLGEAFFAIGYLNRSSDFSAAKAYFNKALDGHPYLTEAYRGLGNSYMEEGRYDLAIVSYRKALDMPSADSADSLLMYLLAQAYEHQGDRESAREYYRQATYADPRNIQAAEALEKL
jgi:putative inorganic carbon (hco3(-)) transporter